MFAIRIGFMLLTIVVAIGCSNQNAETPADNPTVETGPSILGTWVSSTDPESEGVLEATFKESGELQLIVPNSFIMSLISAGIGVPTIPIDPETGEEVPKEGMQDYLNRTFRKSASWRMENDSLFYEIEMGAVEKYESPVDLTPSTLKFKLLEKEVLLFRTEEHE